MRPPSSAANRPSDQPGSEERKLRPEPVFGIPDGIPKQSYYRPQQSSRRALILVLLIVPFHGRCSPTEQMPAGAACRLNSSDSQLSSGVMVRSDEFYTSLIQISPNSVINQVPSATSRLLKQKATSQTAFKSICGWRNSIHPESVSSAFWALDESRAALVAKFVYHSRSEYVDMREATLSSPIFPPIPAYHSMPDSRYHMSCRFNFRAYTTIPVHLEVSLHTVPPGTTVKSSSDARGEDDNLASRAQMPSSRSLKRIVEGTMSTGRQLADREGERAVWIEHQVVLPQDLTLSSFYQLEFSAMSGLISASSMSRHSYLNGIAIANFSLTPQCFGLEVDGEELSRSKIIAGAVHSGGQPISTSQPAGLAISDKRSDMLHLIDVHKIYILISGVVMLLIILIAMQCLMCYLHKEEPSFVSRVCCSMSQRRKQVKQQVTKLEKKSGKQKSAENYLQPLSDVFENVELIANQNYQSGATSFNLLAKTLETYRIDSSHVQLVAEIGKGAFGKVFQGSLECYWTDRGEGGWIAKQISSRADKIDRLDVAVKTLSDKNMGVEDFLCEAINMSQGGNLKNFLVRNREPGYQPHCQMTPTIHSEATSSSPQAHSKSLLLSPSHTQIMHQFSKEGLVDLCMGDLLVFALDIARACDYLQKKQFIHRDLAARNCLLTSSSKGTSYCTLSSSVSDIAGTKLADVSPSAMYMYANYKVDFDQVYQNGYMNSSIVAKLADFGMTRDVSYSQDYYRIAKKEMPVRWMPPECFDGVATTKSDVWSFGVFMWELFSMGEMPYKDLPDNRQVCNLIQSRRYVNEQPLLVISEEDVPKKLVSTYDTPPLARPHDNTPLPIYSIMCSCWATNPVDRPTFEEIANRLYWCLQVPEVLSASLPSAKESDEAIGN